MNGAFLCLAKPRRFEPRDQPVKKPVVPAIAILPGQCCRAFCRGFGTGPVVVPHSSHLLRHLLVTVSQLVNECTQRKTHNVATAQVDWNRNEPAEVRLDDSDMVLVRIGKRDFHRASC